MGTNARRPRRRRGHIRPRSLLLLPLLPRNVCNSCAIHHARRYTPRRSSSRSSRTASSSWDVDEEGRERRRRRRPFVFCQPFSLPPSLLSCNARDPTIRKSTMGAEIAICTGTAGVAAAAHAHAARRHYSCAAQSAWPCASESRSGRRLRIELQMAITHVVPSFPGGSCRAGQQGRGEKGRKKEMKEA